MSPRPRGGVGPVRRRRGARPGPSLRRRGRRARPSRRRAGSAGSEPALGWLARDLARTRAIPEPRRSHVAAFAVGALLAALGLAALRNDMIRQRYALAEAIREEKALQVEQRELTVAVRELRDPSRLAAHARRLGLRRPERLLDLPLAPLRAASGVRQ